MSYAIVYSSQTGNTRLLAETLRQALPQEECLYFGPPSSEALEADTLYVGFWTDKGTCDQVSAEFLKSLTRQTVFLFGTAGFGGAPEYFKKILASVKGLLPPQVSVVGSYMCQGKMPQGVRRRYEAMEAGPRRDMLLSNFDQALSHPNQADLEALVQAIKE